MISGYEYKSAFTCKILYQFHYSPGIPFFKFGFFNVALSLQGRGLVTVFAQTEEEEDSNFEKVLRNQTKVFHKGIPRLGDLARLAQGLCKDCTGLAQGLHRACTGLAQGLHRAFT